MRDQKVTLDYRIKIMMLAYPDLFPSRREAIHHLYCVLGNGYEWMLEGHMESDGDEKEDDVENSLAHGMTEEDVRSRIRLEIEERRKAEWGKFKERVTVEVKKLGIEMPDILKHDKPPDPSSDPESFKCYPVSTSCNIMKIPETVKPDWLMGAMEAVHIMRDYESYDEETTRHNRTLVPGIRQRIKDIATAIIQRHLVRNEVRGVPERSA